MEIFEDKQKPLWGEAMLLKGLWHNLYDSQKGRGREEREKGKGRGGVGGGRRGVLSPLSY